MSRSRQLFIAIDALVLAAFTLYVAGPLRMQRMTVARPATARRLPPPPKAPAPPELTDKLKQLAAKLDATLASKQPILAQQPELAALREQIRTLDAREKAGFEAVDQHLRSQKLPATFLERQQRVVAKYHADMAALEAALSGLANATTDAERRQRLTDARSLLQGHERPAPTPVNLDRLPRRMVRPLSRPPRTTPQEFLAADEVGQLQAALTAETAAPPIPADLAPTDDVQITPAIRDLASTLGRQPVKLFNWVHDNIRFLPTQGSVQGSDLTLTTRQGNAFDTASLLIALLRASDVPARYVQGTVDIPVEKVLNWLGGGLTTETAQALLGQGGIPTTAMIQGGRVSHLRLEHVWVEAFVDFEPSRGAVHKQGDAWIALDAAFKRHQIKSRMDLGARVSIDFSKLIPDVLATTVRGTDGGLNELYPAYIKEKLTQHLKQAQQELEVQLPGFGAGDLLGEARIVDRELSTLAPGLPYKLITRGPARSALSEDQRHSVTLRLYPSPLDHTLDMPDLRYTVSLPVLASRRLSVTYAPASAADAQLIQSYVDAKASSLPIYLVQVVPRVEIDGVTVAEGNVTTMGQDHVWDLELLDPSGRGGGVDSYNVIAGDYIVFGIDGNGLTQQVIDKRLASVSSNTIQENLHQVALHYWFEHDLLDGLAAASNGVVKQRVPSAGMFSFPVDVRYSFGLPREGSYAVELMDVKRVMLAVAAPSEKAQFDFLTQSGLQGSYLEGSVFDQLFNRFQGVSSSTAQVLLDAADAHIPIYTIDASNLATALPNVDISAGVKATISQAVASGKRVIIPQREPRGVSGYVIQDLKTGAAAYMIQDGLSGGRGERCERQPKPVPVPVLKVVLIVLLLMLLAMILAALLASPGGQVLAPEVAVLIFVVGGALMLGTGQAYAGGREACCVVLPVPHLGGDPVHDFCADNIGPNDHPDMDARVDGINFDAVSGQAVLWEVKTHNMANCRNDYCLDNLLPKWIAEAREQLEEGHATAKFCQYLHAFGVGDVDFGNRVGPASAPNLYDTRVVAPDICLQPLK